jgi:hypothetical protein
MKKTRQDTIRNKILRKGDGVQNLLTVTRGTIIMERTRTPISASMHPRENGSVRSRTTPKAGAWASNK